MPDHDEIGTPAWEAMVLRRQADHPFTGAEAAESLRRRADQLDPPAPETAGVFALLRDIADAEPLAGVYGTGDAFGAEVGHRCAMCGSKADDTADGATAPFPHLISCPWARAVQIVGRPAHV
jgi:hypothetical protein